LALYTKLGDSGCLRYVDKEGTVVKAFVQLVPFADPVAAASTYHVVLA